MASAGPFAASGCDDIISAGGRTVNRAQDPAAAKERLALPAVGLPTLGAVGAGLTTSACSLLKLVVVALALLRVPTPEDPGRRRLRPALARRWG